MSFLRPALIPNATLFLGLCARASDAHFDTLAEGAVPATFTDGGITFYGLDGDLGSPSYVFSIEQADGTLAGMPGFSAPMTLGFIGYSGGPGAAFTRCKSFQYTTGQMESSTSVEIFEFGSYAGNTITIEAFLGASVVASQTVTIPSGFGIHHYTLAVSAPAFDSVRVIGGGPQDHGVFFAVVDDVHFGPALTGTVYCSGDGSAAACPCGNTSAPGAGEGCLNSLGTGGTLRALGAASISADSLALQGAQMPNAPALYYQGTAPFSGGLGAAFGDGLRCVGGTVIRLGIKTNVAGASAYPGPGDLSVSQRGLVTSPGMRAYQCWYRNAATYCSISTFNLSNGLEIAWGP